MIQNTIEMLKFMFASYHATVDIQTKRSVIDYLKHVLTLNLRQVIVLNCFNTRNPFKPSKTFSVAPFMEVITHSRTCLLRLCRGHHRPGQWYGGFL